MKKMYLHRIICLLSFLLIFTMYSNAQFAPTHTTIHTPYGPRSITTSQYSPMMRYGNTSANPSSKYDFTIVLLNDSIVKDKGRINISDSVQSITFKEHGTKTRYTPAQTKELYRMTSDGSKISGIPSDTCWLFKTESGKVNFYSCIAEPGTDLVTAIQVGENGAIETLTKERVTELVKQSPHLLKLVERKKLVKALRGYNKE